MHTFLIGGAAREPRRGLIFPVGCGTNECSDAEARKARTMSPLPPLMRVAADTLTVRVGPQGRLEALLVRRANEPFRGMWAIPGGFVELDEDLPDAAARELAEETSVRPASLDQVGAWGRPGRDPRGRTVTAVYVAVARPGQDLPQAGDDAADAAWHPLGELPPLAFDHAAVIPPALEHLRRRCELTHMVFGLLTATFSERELAAALAALGSGAPGEDARRLVEAADLVARDGRADETLYSAGAEDLTRPLRERVCIFSMEHEAG